MDESTPSIKNHSRTEDGFDHFIRPYTNHIYHLAYRFTGNKTDAEDLFQDVVIKAFRQWQEVSQMSKPRAWLSRVTHYTYVDHCRRNSRSPISKAQTYTEEAEEGHRAKVLLASSSDTVSGADKEHLDRIIELALNKLSPERRALIVLHDVEGYTLKELEDILDTPIGTLKSSLHRARRKLRDILQISLKKSNPLEPFPTFKRYY